MSVKPGGRWLSLVRRQRPTALARKMREIGLNKAVRRAGKFRREVEASGLKDLLQALSLRQHPKPVRRTPQCHIHVLMPTPYVL
jgi:hypothetical protein